jgi:ABC-type multidrug transport system fused ATPase/permease subunit
MIRWLGVRLEMIANLLTLFTAISAVFMRDHLTAGTVGLMITFALQITNSLNILVRMSSEIETNIVSVERINEYAELTPEAPWEILETKPSPHWPTNGSIQYVCCITCLESFHIKYFLESKICQHDTEIICNWCSKI